MESGLKPDLGRDARRLDGVGDLADRGEVRGEWLLGEERLVRRGDRRDEVTMEPGGGDDGHRVDIRIVDEVRPVGVRAWETPDDRRDSLDPRGIWISDG